VGTQSLDDVLPAQLTALVGGLANLMPDRVKDVSVGLGVAGKRRHGVDRCLQLFRQKPEETKGSRCGVRLC
jgi:hypothetical protein